jgi:hypothetical protein
VIESLIFCKIDLTAVRAFPKEEGTVLDLVLEFGIVRDVDTLVDYDFVLLTAFAAGCECFVDY